jgi:hypothetical protein
LNEVLVFKFLKVSIDSIELKELLILEWFQYRGAVTGRNKSSYWSHPELFLVKTGTVTGCNKSSYRLQWEQLLAAAIAVTGCNMSSYWLQQEQLLFAKKQLLAPTWAVTSSNKSS